MSIAQFGTSIPHSLSYILTYDLSVPHGAAVAYFLPGFLAAACEKDRKEILDLSGFANMADFDSFINDALGTMDVPGSVLEKTYDAVRNNSVKMNSASFPVDDDTLYNIVFKRSGLPSFFKE